MDTDITLEHSYYTTTFTCTASLTTITLNNYSLLYIFKAKVKKRLWYLKGTKTPVNINR